MVTLHTTVILAFALLVLAPLAHAQHSAMPAGMTHEQHMEQMKKDAAMKEHGKHAMGFDQDTTAHHFTLAANGGAISVDANAEALEALHAFLRYQITEHATGDPLTVPGAPQPMD